MCSLGSRSNTVQKCDTDLLFYDCNCAPCNLTRPCASDSGLLHCACPEGAIYTGSALFVYPPFSSKWLEKDISFVEPLLGCFSGFWGSMMWPAFVWCLFFLVHSLRTHGLSATPIKDVLGTMFTVVVMAAPSVVLPLGSGWLACVVALCLTTLATIRHLRLNWPLIFSELPDPNPSRVEARNMELRRQAAWADRRAAARRMVRQVSDPRTYLLTYQPVSQSLLRTYLLACLLAYLLSCMVCQVSDPRNIAHGVVLGTVVQGVPMPASGAAPVASL